MVFFCRRERLLLYQRGVASRRMALALVRFYLCVCVCVCVRCLVVPDSATPWTVARQASLSMGFSRQEYWSGLPFPSPGDLPNQGIESRSPALQADSLLSESGSWWWTGRPGVLQFMGSQSRTRLSDWTELNWAIYLCIKRVHNHFLTLYKLCVHVRTHSFSC